MKIAFITLGCKVNQYETQFLKQQFQSKGFNIVSPNEIADVYIINSCTVTSTGDKKTRQLVRRCKSNNRNAIIVLTGCFPQAFPKKAAEISEADIITGTTNKSHIFDIVYKKLLSKQNLQIINIKPYQENTCFEKMSVNKFSDKTRAFIKIQDGCDRFCSYCIIPIARGRIRSKSLDDIKNEVEILSSNGHKEIVLVGINLPSYGKDLGLNLIDAVETIANIKSVKRIRLSSLEPEMLTLNDIKQLSNIKSFCPQFHLCLQSGCDSTLKRMNRHYNTNEYSQIVQMIRENIKNPSITTDLMVGFPCETDDEFYETLNFIQKIGFSRVHVFPYSKRDGTAAAKMPNQISNDIKHQRCTIAINLANKMQLSFLKSQIGLQDEVLFETSINQNIYQGYSKNYTHVIAKSSENIIGKIKQVDIIDVNNNSCIANVM